MQKQTDRFHAIGSLQKIVSKKQSLSDSDFSNAFVQELVYGTCRYYFYLKELLKKLLQKPLKKDDLDIELLLLVGLYQLIYLDVAQYAAINETVEVARELKKAWAVKLVNGVLREFLRQKEILLSVPDPYFAHPQWLYEKVLAAWPEHYTQILQANNARPPMTLRINLASIVLEKPKPVEEIEGFKEGKVFVQDAAAQLAANLLELKPDQLVLDACAAPGGKTTHILELEPQLKQLIAIDCEEKRLVFIKENLNRLKLNHLPVDVLLADAGKPDAWWDKKLFDRILLDAPCSATGVIRRHPDIKLLRKPNDIAKLVQQQKHLLNTLWSLLKPDGLLLYATCSIFPEENVEIISEFLTTHTDAKELKIEASWGVAQKFGRQILPGMDNMDGFYYARLVKK